MLKCYKEAVDLIISHIKRGNEDYHKTLKKEV